MRKTQNRFDVELLTSASNKLRAISHQLRLQILGFIDSNDEINVNKIYNTLGLEQSITSQHLRILRAEGLVETTRDGKYVFYSINYKEIENILAAIRGYEERVAADESAKEEAE